MLVPAPMVTVPSEYIVKVGTATVRVRGLALVTEPEVPVILIGYCPGVAEFVAYK